MKLQGKRVVVTGGGQGIGKAVARRCLEDGARVCIIEVDPAAGKETAQELGALGEIRAIRGDVGREGDVRSAVRQAARHLGGIDVLVNNAGIWIEEALPVERLSLAAWNRVLAVNLTSVFLCTKYALPFMPENGAAVVNIASTRAVMSEPDTMAYSASKGGIVALTHSLAVSLGPRVRVNCISPGWIETSLWKKKGLRHEPELRPVDNAQHPGGRVGRPEDIAAAVAFLASGESGFVTGANLVIDGGMTRKMIYA
jgi:NAD(P)-dependent dehydrogenase (short-subunit alcohol dehydrogenase family)